MSTENQSEPRSLWPSIGLIVIGIALIEVNQLFGLLVLAFALWHLLRSPKPSPPTWYPPPERKDSKEITFADAPVPIQFHEAGGFCEICEKTVGVHHKLWVTYARRGPLCMCENCRDALILRKRSLSRIVNSD